MPGSNHDIDATFMDSLPLAVRDAALELIRFSSLDEMLDYKINGPSDFLQNKFELTGKQWFEVLNAVIITKISYFDIQVHFPNRYIDKLIEIAAFTANKSSTDPVGLYRSMLTDHPKFAEWIKNAIKVKQQNIQIAVSKKTN